MLLKIDGCENTYYNDLTYSARKNRVNGPVTFSTQKLNTSFNSPSVKSSGAPLVSARVEIKQFLARGQDVKNSQVFLCNNYC